jgi:hypothetical protein
VFGDRGSRFAEPRLVARSRGPLLHVSYNFLQHSDTPTFSGRRDTFQSTFRFNLPANTPTSAFSVVQRNQEHCDIVIAFQHRKGTHQPIGCTGGRRLGRPSRLIIQLQTGPFLKSTPRAVQPSYHEWPKCTAITCVSRRQRVELPTAKRQARAISQQSRPASYLAAELWRVCWDNGWWIPAASEEQRRSVTSGIHRQVQRRFEPVCKERERQEYPRRQSRSHPRRTLCLA